MCTGTSNELMNRLRLLDASYRAGNNAHDNEMLSIIEEDPAKREKLTPRDVEELHAPARRNFPRRRVIVRGYDDLWQADIVEIRPYSSFNRGYYILTIIDELSAWARPLKSKGGSETADAIVVEIIRVSGRCPKNLQTDMRKEFYNADVQKILKKHDVNHYSTYSTLKASVVERFNRTLKNDMWKMFTLLGNYQRANPVTYLLEDYHGKSAGAFYEHELHRDTHPDVYLVEKVLHRKRNKVYVKWLGFDGSHNSWIHKNNVI
ncbi:PREDICTED: uncharacterized protein LOC105144999 [Acromyrmex echinatior]|uniref:uncharacterized protein LOC105144999 n=1 Tax=Acromyrmex echinatior TaxID=103372 RepID=UPI000580F4C6|nr:PREDICTED: uncharacterized protein LOC105144999 [Acromyrmex echinatior]